MSEDATPYRAHWIPAPHFFNLNQACRVLHEAFPDAWGIFLVGSSLRTRDYRDVDVRCILPDDAFDRLFPGTGNGPWWNALWSVMCSSISLQLSQQSGLPIDFQIQRATQANAEYPGEKRNAIGLFLMPAQGDATP